MSYSNTSGNVYWITGLAGSGKTTIAQIFHNALKKTTPNLVILDGDTLREIQGHRNDFSQEKRFELAMMRSRFCHMLSQQNIHVICATISMFHEVRNWNKKNIRNYCEIYVRVPLDVLIERDKKNLYSRAVAGKIKNVVGVDIRMEEPKKPNIILNNHGVNTPETMLNLLLSNIELPG